MATPLTELRLISRADPASIEVIFVHGLNGNAEFTWNFQNQPSWHTWIQNIHPTSRIWSLNYRVNSSWWQSGSMPIQDRAVNVLATIHGELSGETPILFVCHSYGGLLVKQMLSTGLGRAQSEYRCLAARVRGVVFLSTPHNGSRIADYIHALRSVLRSSTAVAELKQNAPSLRDLAGWFSSHAKASNWKVRVFFETMNTGGIRVVCEDSSDPHITGVTPIGIDADHFEICKPPRPDVRVTQTNVLIDEILRAEPPGSASDVAKAVAAHLPLLRRYARILAGSQQAGDPFVGAVLEMFKRAPQSFNVEKLRVILFTMITGLWNALSHGVRLQNLPESSKVARITSLPRQAFLLLGLEGFSEEEAAEILSVDIDRVRALVADAGRELAQYTAVRVLIIEDETFMAMDIESLVRNMGHTVTGVARTHKEATELWHKSRADLILADMQLADGSSGLDAVNELCSESNVPAIFITTWPERVLTGSRPEPAFLISKPFQPAMLAAVISQVLFLGGQAIDG